MTAESVIRGLNLDPVSGQHRGSRVATTVGDVSLEGAVLENSFNFELGRLQTFFDENNAAYQSRRTHLRQSPTQLRIISDRGIEQLAALGLRNRGRGVPIFRYFPPKTNDGIRPFRDSISFIVMHSFGRDFDKAITGSLGTRTVAIDPQTGHNPRRFANGMTTLLDPSARSRAAVHHMVSLRGDLVNSVGWDNRSVHGGGGGIGGINDYSIGIEHEEWYLRPEVGRRSREIEDHGPYSEEQYAIDAFIMKKLQTYTQQDFRVYLGTGNTLLENIERRTVGCFNHASVSGHADPGAEFFLPPDFRLHETDLTSLEETRGRPGAWERRFDLWYSNVPRGTRISAYARIFEKVGRLRSFNLQTEIFDPAIGGGRVEVTPPEVRGTYTVAAAERAARDRITGVERVERMQGVTRSGLYAAAQDTNSAAATAWAEHTTRLAQVTEGSLRLPVIINALGFDYSTGMWINNTSRNEPTTEQISDRAARINTTPTTTNTNPTSE